MLMKHLPNGIAEVSEVLAYNHFNMTLVITNSAISYLHKTSVEKHYVLDVFIVNNSAYIAVFKESINVIEVN